MSTSNAGVLVTGGAGFIGAAVVRSLLARGADVTVADKRPSAEHGVRSVTGDLRRPEIVDQAMARPVAAIVHLAAETSVLASTSNPVEVYETNVALTLALLERCRVGGVRSFVLASTNAVVGDVGEALIDEESPLRPLTPYGATKAAAEMLVSAYSASYDIAGSAVRLTNVYGPGMQEKDSLVARLMRTWQAQGSVSIYGDGDQVRDYLYIDDAVQGILLALDTGVVGPVTVGSGISTSVNDLHHLLGDVTGIDLALPHVAARPGEMPAVRVRIDQARRLGYQPRTNLRQGLEATWEFFRGSGRATDAGDGGSYGVPHGSG
ncbi:MAG TPA: NAD-dependent epimerase/dehydratase family protein [Acidimicrobiales bacterium]|nr:NAD-dependent epimerase/dehydratase family protein [Acidimicrobiales bacterium]